MREQNSHQRYVILTAVIRTAVTWYRTVFKIFINSMSLSAFTLVPRVLSLPLSREDPGKEVDQPYADTCNAESSLGPVGRRV